MYIPVCMWKLKKSLVLYKQHHYHLLNSINILKNSVRIDKTSMVVGIGMWIIKEENINW